MYRFVLILSLSIFSIEATNISDSEAKIVEFKNENNGLGNYFFRYVTSNGITRDETARIINSGEPDEHIDVEGFYSYKDPDGALHTVYYNFSILFYFYNDTNGVLQSVHYKADTNGFVIFDPFAGLYKISETVVASLLG